MADIETAAAISAFLAALSDDRRKWLDEKIRDHARKDKGKRRHCSHGCALGMRCDHFVTTLFGAILWHLQQGKCFHCDGDLLWGRRKGGDQCSFDRIDNALPHTADNCVFTHSKCNIARGHATIEEYAESKGTTAQAQELVARAAALCAWIMAHAR